jgi:hypothetical protein
MKQISEIFTPGKDSILGATRKAQEITRKYERKEVLYCAERPKRARFKLWVAFNDGNKRIFYSYDFVTEESKTKIDEWAGLVKLLRALDKWRGKYKTAVIYTTLEPKADTSKKLYNQNNIAGKFTALYERHNPSICFKLHSWKGIDHNILEMAQFDTNYFKVGQ